MATKHSTRERLLDAAEQVFADKGFYEGAVDEIVERSGTSKGSVYFHFPSKETLFFAVVEQMGKRLLRRVERDVASVTDPGDRLEAAMESTLRTLCKHKTLAKLLLVKGASMGTGFTQERQAAMAGLAELTAGLIADATAGADGPALDPQVAAHAWLGAVSEIVVLWIETGSPDPIEEALPTLRVMLKRGLGLESAS